MHWESHCHRERDDPSWTDMGDNDAKYINDARWNVISVWMGELESMRGGVTPINTSVWKRFPAGQVQKQRSRPWPWREGGKKKSVLTISTFSGFFAFRGLAKDIIVSYKLFTKTTLVSVETFYIQTHQDDYESSWILQDINPLKGSYSLMDTWTYSRCVSLVQPMTYTIEWRGYNWQIHQSLGKPEP